MHNKKNSLYIGIFSLIKSGLFISIIVGLWVSIYQCLLSMENSLFAYPLGLLTGIFNYLFFIKFILHFKLIPEEIIDESDKPTQTIIIVNVSNNKDSINQANLLMEKKGLSLEDREKVIELLEKKIEN